MHGPGASENPSLQDPRGVNPAPAPNPSASPSQPQSSTQPDVQRGQSSGDLDAHPLARGTHQGAVPGRRSAEVESQRDSATRQTVPTLSRGDLGFVAVMLALILLLSGYHLVRRYGWNATELAVLPAPEKYQFTLDINSATWVEWLQLEGIGEVLARRIIEYREVHGPFRSIDDLSDVQGIGDATLEKMRPYLTIDSIPEESN